MFGLVTFRNRFACVGFRHENLQARKELGCPQGHTGQRSHPLAKRHGVQLGRLQALVGKS